MTHKWWYSWFMFTAVVHTGVRWCLLLQCRCIFVYLRPCSLKPFFDFETIFFFFFFREDVSPYSAASLLSESHSSCRWLCTHPHPRLALECCSWTALESLTTSGGKQVHLLSLAAWSDVVLAAWQPTAHRIYCRTRGTALARCTTLRRYVAYIDNNRNAPSLSPERKREGTNGLNRYDPPFNLLNLLIC